MTAPEGAQTRNKTTNWTAYNATLKAFYRLGYAIWKLLERRPPQKRGGDKDTCVKHLTSATVRQCGHWCAVR